MTENIRRAIPDDIADIVAMVHDLAEFERAADQCTVTEKQMYTALFGPYPTVRGHVVDSDGQITAMALWFLNFSTWDGVAGIFRRRSLCAAKLSPPWPGPQADGHTGR
ncbi:hypothetical protein LAUMK13_01171 [Mycobacterium innocens]|uniref:N-acetyltransferase domain-containing protein n=1 Tax=Mycobacterium innocens TaxID=2341083 RepID=A0A498PU50_9MYCO|nr:hypothetical protein LAUMK13_01171 [Mycobacterium innocens]